MYCVVSSQPLWCLCPSRCFIATGYSIGFGQWYRRYCGICISFPQSPVGQPGAVYLSGYKAASQRAKGKGNRTEVGVKGTGCHCVFQQGCEICKCTAEGGFIIQRAVCDSYKQAYMYERFHPHRRTICSHSTHSNMNVNMFILQHFASTPSAEPFPTHSPFILNRFVQPAPFYLFSPTCSL